jgi:hypothetical protein
MCQTVLFSMTRISDPDSIWHYVVDKNQYLFIMDDIRGTCVALSGTHL